MIGHHWCVHIVAAPDKFKGTASAREIADAIAAAAEVSGATCTRIPMADGGEGTLEALGGPNRTSLVTGPLGNPVEAEWRLDGKSAVIEMARSSGLVLAGGPDENDPLGATTAGVGELIGNAIDAGASTIIIGVGGSATTDGGLGALDALRRARGGRRGPQLTAVTVLTSRNLHRAGEVVQAAIECCKETVLQLIMYLSE